MIRESIDPNSKMVWSSFSRSESNEVFFRDTFGIQQVVNSVFNKIYWGWSKIVKKGNLVRVYSSDDGKTFYQTFEYSFPSFSDVTFNNLTKEF
jgi:hypothetical protein